jgi:hypothetical protein
MTIRSSRVELVLDLAPGVAVALFKVIGLCFAPPFHQSSSADRQWHTFEASCAHHILHRVGLEGLKNLLIAGQLLFGCPYVVHACTRHVPLEV